MKEYKLIGRDGKPYMSSEPGTMGGHRKLKIYGRLDCPSALRYIAKGQYVEYRVFFADEETAIAAGYRPCGICMRKEYKQWKSRKEQTGQLEFVENRYFGFRRLFELSQITTCNLCAAHWRKMLLYRH